MRPILALAVAAALFAPLAQAKDKQATDDANVDCTVDAKPNDRVAKGKDVVVQAGESVDDAVAVDGNVVIRSGATVKNALALHGSVTVEAGASVQASVIAIGGRTHIHKDAKVKGSTVSLDKHEGLRVRGEDGNEINLSVSVGSESLAQQILKPMIAGIHRCKVVEVPGK